MGEDNPYDILFESWKDASESYNDAMWNTFRTFNPFLSNPDPKTDEIGEEDYKIVIENSFDSESFYRFAENLGEDETKAKGALEDFSEEIGKDKEEVGYVLFGVASYLLFDEDEETEMDETLEEVSEDLVTTNMSVPETSVNDISTGENTMKTKTKGMDVDLTHKGADVYRENQDIYGELNREQTQALGAAAYLHEHAGGSDIDVDLEEMVDFTDSNGLKEEFESYKKRMPDFQAIDEAATAVVQTLENSEAYLEEARTESGLYIPMAEEQSELMRSLGSALNSAHQAADDVDVGNYSFAEDLRQSRRGVLEVNEEETQRHLREIRDRLDN